MSEISDRIKEIRATKGLTMEQFGARIGLGKSAVNKIEKGINGTTDQTIQSICREFGVSEVWLRTGEGQMLDDAADSILDRLAAEYHLDDRKRAILIAFLKLSPADQDAILRYVNGIAAELAVQQPADDVLDIDAEVEAYRQELLAQKKAEADASASGGAADAS